MPNRPWVAIDLVIVSALVRLVAEEVNSGISNSIRLLGLVFQVCKAVCFIPAVGEDVEGYLTAD